MAINIKIWKNLKRFFVDIVNMVKRDPFKASIVLTGILGGLLAFFLLLPTNFDSYWASIILKGFKTIGYYFMGFLFIYCFVAWATIAPLKFQIKENKAVRIFTTFIWIICFVTIIMILGFISSFVIIFFSKYMPKPLTLILTYSTFLFFFVFVRDIINEKSGLDLFNVNTFFKD